jgi:hypothetical protein
MQIILNGLGNRLAAAARQLVGGTGTAEEA